MVLWYVGKEGGAREVCKMSACGPTAKKPTELLDDARKGDPAAVDKLLGEFREPLRQSDRLAARPGRCAPRRCFGHRSRRACRSQSAAHGIPQKAGHAVPPVAPASGARPHHRHAPAAPARAAAKKCRPRTADRLPGLGEMNRACRSSRNSLTPSRTPTSAKRSGSELQRRLNLRHRPAFRRRPRNHPDAASRSAFQSGSGARDATHGSSRSHAIPASPAPPADRTLCRMVEESPDDA